MGLEQERVSGRGCALGGTRAPWVAAEGYEATSLKGEGTAEGKLWQGLGGDWARSPVSPTEYWGGGRAVSGKQAPARLLLESGPRGA